MDRWWDIVSSQPSQILSSTNPSLHVDFLGPLLRRTYTNSSSFAFTAFSALSRVNTDQMFLFFNRQERGHGRAISPVENKVPTYNRPGLGTQAGLTKAIPGNSVKDVTLSNRKAAAPITRSITRIMTSVSSPRELVAESLEILHMQDLPRSSPSLSESRSRTARAHRGHARSPSWCEAEHVEFSAGRRRREARSIPPVLLSEEGKKKENESTVIRTFRKSAMRGLRLDAVADSGGHWQIFLNHDDQREWIIETSAHDVRLTAQAKARQNKIVLRRQESFSESQSQVAEEFLDEKDTAVGREGDHHLSYSAGKATKNLNKAEYHTILDNLISDLLAVLYWPEYPALFHLKEVIESNMCEIPLEAALTEQAKTCTGVMQMEKKIKKVEKGLDRKRPELDMTEAHIVHLEGQLQNLQTRARNLQKELANMKRAANAMQDPVRCAAPQRRPHNTAPRTTAVLGAPMFIDTQGPALPQSHISFFSLRKVKKCGTVHTEPPTRFVANPSFVLNHNSVQDVSPPLHENGEDDNISRLDDDEFWIAGRVGGQEKDTAFHNRVPGPKPAATVVGPTADEFGMEGTVGLSKVSFQGPSTTAAACKKRPIAKKCNTRDNIKYHQLIQTSRWQMTR
ncbi:hypothetical protein DFH07DRAFT_776320 [Mycena maculata]|uniref:Uncharacterized protein n=1 Tax=Mycena maculata TaxID=230809 RepID=A0AAD7IQ98_9AGAR|nr:hypothetical protein DFH07DRAFT_776320 [Mycena maculata]